MLTRLCDPYDVPHELQRLLGRVDTVLRIPVLKLLWQAGHWAGDSHIPIAASDDVFCLLAEAPLLRVFVALIPDSSSSPNPASLLEGISGGGQLPFVLSRCVCPPLV